MSSDGPKSGRMGFGYQQAVEAGVPYEQPKSTARLNLDSLLKKRPEYKARVMRELKEGGRADRILNDLRDEGVAGKYYIAFYSGQDAEQFVDDRYTD